MQFCGPKVQFGGPKWPGRCLNVFSRCHMHPNSVVYFNDVDGSFLT